MDKSKSPHLQTPGEREEFLNNSLLLPPTLTDIFNISFAMIPVLHNIVIKDTGGFSTCTKYLSSSIAA